MLYYYLKVAFQQSFLAPDIGLTRKEFVLFISSGSSGLAHEENSGEFAEWTRKLEPFSAAIVIEVRI